MCVYPEREISKPNIYNFNRYNFQQGQRNFYVNDLLALNLVR